METRHQIIKNRIHGHITFKLMVQIHEALSGISPGYITDPAVLHHRPAALAHVWSPPLAWLLAASHPTYILGSTCKEFCPNSTANLECAAFWPAGIRVTGTVEAWRLKFLRCCYYWMDIWCVTFIVSLTFLSGACETVTQLHKTEYMRSFPTTTCLSHAWTQTNYILLPLPPPHPSRQPQAH